MGKLTGYPENKPTCTVVHVSKAGQTGNIEIGVRREWPTVDIDG